VFGLVVGTVTHHADEGWSVAGKVHPVAETAGAVAGEFVAVPVALGTNNLPVKRGDAIGIEVFAPASGALTNRPAVELRRGAKLQVAGWAADATAGGPCKAVYVTIRDAHFGIPYGFTRGDVAAYFKNDAYTSTGFSGTVSTSTLPTGTTAVTINCLSADGKTVYAAPGTHELTID
jgi:hypothetical protein